jgi:hypothetical protein
VRIHLRCAAGQVKHLDRVTAGEFKQQLHRLPGHLLGPLRAGGDVTVQAGLVAAIAEVGLKGFQRRPDKRREIGFYEQGKGVAHHSFRQSLAISRAGTAILTRNRKIPAKRPALRQKPRRENSAAPQAPSPESGAPRGHLFATTSCFAQAHPRNPCSRSMAASLRHRSNLASARRYARCPSACHPPSTGRRDRKESRRYRAGKSAAEPGRCWRQPAFRSPR